VGVLALIKIIHVALVVNPRRRSPRRNLRPVSRVRSTTLDMLGMTTPLEGGGMITDVLQVGLNLY